jgi:hypothetical protein
LCAVHVEQLCAQAFLSLTSFFHALALSRSLSNSLETSLTTVAIAHYPWDASTYDRYVSSALRWPLVV